MLAAVLLLLVTGGAVVSAQKPAQFTGIQAELLEVQEEFVKVKVTKPVGDKVTYFVQHSQNNTVVEFPDAIFKVESLKPNTDVSIFIKACGLPELTDCTDTTTLDATTISVDASITRVGTTFVNALVLKPRGEFLYLVHTSDNETEKEFEDTSFQVEGLTPGTDVDIFIKACGPTLKQNCTDHLRLNATTTDWPAPTRLQIRHQDPDNDTETTYYLSWELPSDNALVNNIVSITGGNASWTETFGPWTDGAVLPLKYGTSYNVTVTAKYLLDVSSSSVFRESEPLSFKTSVGKPGPVRNLTAVQWKYTNEVYVSWELPKYPKGTPTRYTVEIWDEDNLRKAKFYTYGDLSTNATISKAKRHMDYTVKVIAANSLDTDKYVDGAAAKCTLTFEAPEKPKMLQTNASADSVVVQVLSPIDDKLEYHVQPNQIEKNATFQVSGYKPHTNITILVAACFGSFPNSVCSEWASLNATTNVGAPARVESLAVKIIDDKPALSWNAPKELNGPLDGYEVTVVSSDSSAVTVSLDANFTSYTYEDAFKCERYRIEVSAFNLDIFDKEVRIRGPPNDIAVDFGCSGGVNASFTQIGADFVTVKVTDPQYGFSYLVHTSKNQTEVEFKSSMFRVGGLKPLTYVVVYIKACRSEARHKCSEPLKLDATTTDWPAPSKLRINHQGPDNDTETIYSLSWKLPLNGALINTIVSITDGNASRTETVEAWRGGTLLPLKYGTSYDITVTAEYLPDVSSSSVFRESEPLSFKTIVGKPGPVRNLTAVQWKYTNEVYVSWELPEYPKGTPARYTVEVRDEEKQRKAKLYTNGDLSTNATILKAASDTNYTVEVIAANHLYGDKYVDGTPALCILTFEGPEKPEMLQIGASADSVAVQVQRPIDDKLRYYVQANHLEKNTTFQVSGYKPHTNITIFVAACFGSSANPICSELGSLNATTNVGEPARVESLAVKIIDDKPALSWNAPKELNGPLDGYEVTVVSSNSSVVTVSLDANSTSYTFEDAIKCERYNIGVSAFNLDIFDKGVRIRGPPNDIAVDFGCSEGTSFPGWATALIVVSLLVVCIGVGIAVAKRRGLIDTNLPTVSYSVSRS